jgi:phasin family protein
MADDTKQLTNKALEASRTMVDAMQGVAYMQSNMLQRLIEAQSGLIKQGSEAANEQLQLIARVGDPHEFATAQAALVKRHGQLYMDQLKNAVDVIAGAWEEYGDRIEKSVDTITDKAQRAPSPKKSS